jgi:hypothetical protein
MLLETDAQMSEKIGESGGVDVTVFHAGKRGRRVQVTVNCGDYTDMSGDDAVQLGRLLISAGDKVLVETGREERTREKESRICGVCGAPPGKRCIQQRGVLSGCERNSPHPDR